MKKKLLYFIIISLFSFPILTFGQVLNLGTLSNFAAYSGSGAVSNEGTSTLNGDIGSNEGAVTGFGLPSIAGTIHNVNATTAQAKIDLLRVYIHLSALAVTNTTHAAAFGSGETITAGVYSIGGAGSLAGAITLDGQGNTNAVFIIKFEGAFTAGAGSNIILANGTRACNVYWIAEGAITIGALSTAKGTLIAHPGAITVAAGSTLEGRMLTTEGAITFGPGQASMPSGPITIPISCDTNYNNNILGTAANFALFTSVGAVANAETSGIVGDIGSNAGDLSGFASSTVAGSFYNADAVTAQAKIDLQAAYVQLHNMPATNPIHTPAFGSGETLRAGVYHIAAAGSLAGTITLDAQGNPDAFFLFKFDGAFVTAAHSKVVLANGARRCNVFWVADGAISMGTFTFMKGTLIANNGANTMGAYGNLEGRMFSTTGAIGFSTGLIYNNTLCFADPIAVIAAVSDIASVNGNTGGATPALTNNDTLNGNLITIGTAAGDVTMTTGILPTGITVDTTTGIVTVAPQTLSGTYRITYTICEVTKVGNCSTTNATVTVIASASAPTAITGNATICNGTSTTLTATGGAMSATSSYQWGTGSTVGSNIITGQTAASITVSPAFDTVYWTRRVDIATDNITGGVTLTVSIISSVGGTLSGNQYICAGASASDIVLTGNVGNVVKWQKSNDPTFAVTTDIPTTATILLSSTIGLLNVTTHYRAIVANGSCSSAISGTATIDVKPLLGSIDGISGSTMICGVNSATYSVAPVDNATNYIWTFPSGMSVYSSVGNSVVVHIDELFRDGVITVKAANGCQVTMVKTITITKKLASITGPISTCGITTKTTYSVPNTIGTNFTWTVPSWMSIVSGQGTNIITVSVGTSFTNDNVRINFLSNCNTKESFILYVGCNKSTNVKDFQCGTTLVNLDSSVYPNPVSGSQAYKYQVTNGTNVRLYEPITPLFNLTQLPGGATYNTTYSVQVAVKINGVWGGFGLPCDITTPSPVTKVKAANCGTTLATISTSVYADALIGVQGYRFEVTDSNNNLRTFDATTNLFNLTQLAGGVNYNTSYTIRVAAIINSVCGAYGTSCTITTPGVAATKVIDSQCGTTLIALNSSIYYIAVYGAQAYRFEVINGTTVITYDLTNTANLFNLTQLLGGAAYATTYSIRVASNVNGTWSTFGTVCTINTPAAITKVKAQFCGTTLVTLNSSIYANALIGVQGYRFEVTDGTNVRTFDATSNLFNLTQLINGAAYGTNYTIRVGVNVKGVWGAYGASCVVTTPVNTTSNTTSKTAVISGTKSVTKSVPTDATMDYTAKAYPNPFKYNFKLKLTSASEDNVEVMVYDMLGRMITSKTVDAATINTIELGEEYTASVYNVIIRQGNDIKILRMIKI